MEQAKRIKDLPHGQEFVMTLLAMKRTELHYGAGLKASSVRGLHQKAMIYIDTEDSLGCKAGLTVKGIIYLRERGWVIEDQSPR